MTAQIERLQRVMQVVEEKEAIGEWDQDAWGIAAVPQDDDDACGTACCFAGWAAMTEPTVTPLWQLTYSTNGISYRTVSESGLGIPMAALLARLKELRTESANLWVEDDAALRNVRDEKTGEVRLIQHWAKDYFGIDADEADLLFRSENDLDDLRLIVKELCDHGELAVGADGEFEIYDRLHDYNEASEPGDEVAAEDIIPAGMPW